MWILKAVIHNNKGAALGSLAQRGGAVAPGPGRGLCRQQQSFVADIRRLMLGRDGDRAFGGKPAAIAARNKNGAVALSLEKLCQL